MDIISSLANVKVSQNNMIQMVSGFAKRVTRVGYSTDKKHRLDNKTTSFHIIIFFVKYLLQMKLFVWKRDKNLKYNESLIWHMV